jgi:hypothetical protein
MREAYLAVATLPHLHYLVSPASVSIPGLMDSVNWVGIMCTDDDSAHVL